MTTTSDDSRQGETLEQHILRALGSGEDLEILDGHLLLHGGQEPDYPGGVEYGPYPYSDAVEILDLRSIPGYTQSDPPGAQNVISVMGIDGDTDHVRVTSQTRSMRIHREDADPEHRHLEYRMAATWFGNTAAQ